ncbi:hypothetical protein LSUE1_G003003 [Lachnellula suecica]|uniref:HD domain-containing protein n=1 Tax=Lachnellula suecica TaxID=602035 RepID=A0A8T9CAL7_9HELO|nr:hypothetical protein LSUE1_G003003 [Lachnellula suecica]
MSASIPTHRDVELHAIAAILHDLGWDKTGELVTIDKRFEVDGANAARDFLLLKADQKDWPKQRLQLLWDSIALPQVSSCCAGIFADFTGPERSFGGVLTRTVWEAVLKEYPRLEFKKGVISTFCGLCRDKPETTYDNFASEFGVAYKVEGYSLGGKDFWTCWRPPSDFF